MSSEKRSGFSKMYEDLVGIGGSGNAFRSAMLVLLLGCIGYGGWLEWQSWQVKPFVPTAPKIEESKQDASVETLPERFKSLWKIRNESKGVSRSIRDSDRYAFNSFPPPEAVPDPEELRKKEESERERALLEAQRLQEESIYNEINPNSFMFVKSLMTGKNGRRTALIEFTHNDLGLFEGIPVANDMGSRYFPVYAGVRIPVKALDSEILVTDVGKEFVSVKVRNGTWKLPVPGDLAQPESILYPAEPKPKPETVKKSEKPAEKIRIIDSEPKKKHVVAAKPQKPQKSISKRNDPKGNGKVIKAPVKKPQKQSVESVDGKTTTNDDAGNPFLSATHH